MEKDVLTTESYKGYTGSIEFSEEDNVYHGKLLDIKDLVTYEALNKPRIQEVFEQAVDHYIELKEELHVPSNPLLIKPKDLSDKI
jgi:predicted HicB family RNase H-like nuclease